MHIKKVQLNQLSIFTQISQSAIYEARWSMPFKTVWVHVSLSVYKTQKNCPLWVILQMFTKVRHSAGSDEVDRDRKVESGPIHVSLNLQWTKHYYGFHWSFNI